MGQEENPLVPHQALICPATLGSPDLPGRSSLVAAAATAPVAAAIHLAVAIGAIDRLVTTRHKWHLGVLAAIGAYDLRHCALGAAITATTAVASATAVATIATTVA